MENLSIILNPDGIEYVNIDKGNDEFVSMLKSDYDAQQAAVND